MVDEGRRPEDAGRIADAVEPYASPDRSQTIAGSSWRGVDASFPALAAAGVGFERLVDYRRAIRSGEGDP